MKVLILAAEYPPANSYGLARYTSDLASALVALGVVVHVVCMNFVEGIANYTHRGVEVHLLKERPPFTSFQRVSEVVLDNIWLLERAVEVAEREKFDLICAHDWLAALAARSLRGIYNIPLVLTIHGIRGEKRDKPADLEQCYADYVASVEEWISREVSLVIATSEFMRLEIAKKLQMANDIAVVRLAVDPVQFETNCNLRDFRRIFAADEGKIVLFVGRLAESKGPQVLLEAARAIVRDFPETVFVFAGDGDMRETLCQTVAQWRLEKHVFFAGYLCGKVLAAMYRVADCVVVPGLLESSGMPIVEAMICRTPTIVSDVGGLAEIVEHEVNGLKVPPGDANSLAREIARLLQDSSLQMPIVNKAEKMCRENWLWGKTAAQIKGLYDKL